MHRVLILIHNREGKLLIIEYEAFLLYEINIVIIIFYCKVNFYNNAYQKDFLYVLLLFMNVAVGSGSSFFLHIHACAKNISTFNSEKSSDYGVDCWWECNWFSLFVYCKFCWPRVCIFRKEESWRKKATSGLGLWKRELQCHSLFASILVYLDYESFVMVIYIGLTWV